MLAVANGPSDERGAVALAHSNDLEHWTVATPAYAPGLFGQLEVPQVISWAGSWHLLFCTPATSHSAQWLRSHRAQTGTYHVVGASPTGPFTTEPRPVLEPTAATFYAGKLHTVGGRLLYLASILTTAVAASDAISLIRWR